MFDLDNSEPLLKKKPLSKDTPALHRVHLVVNNNVVHHFQK